MKHFISQPMKDKSEQTILEERADMIARIKEQDPDAEILDSYFEDYKPSTGNVTLKYLLLFKLSTTFTFLEKSLFNINHILILNVIHFLKK